MIRVAGLTTTGLLRGNNEDSAAVDGRFLTEDTVASFDLNDGPHLLVLADGIGGYDYGEVAAQTAVESLSGRAAQLIDEQTCADHLRAVNEDLHAAMRRERDLVGMGTTVVGVVVHGTRAVWFNVGDSRAYLYRNGLNQLTIDHVPATLLPDGQRSHTLTQWLGGFDEDEDLWPEVGTISFEPGDKLLLCSDGLTDVLGDDEIAAMLARGLPADASVRALVDEVMSRGAPDNTTILLAQR